MNNEKGIWEENSDEVQLLEFFIGNNRYGVDAARVREMLQYPSVRELPDAGRYVEGMISLRNELLTVIDLAGYLKLPASDVPERDLLVVIDSNGAGFGLRVHRISGILRVAKEEIEKPDMFREADSIVEGVVKLGKDLMFILNFEQLLTEISPQGPDSDLNSDIMKSQQFPDIENS